MRKHFRHLTHGERCQIAALIGRGLTDGASPLVWGVTGRLSGGRRNVPLSCLAALCLHCLKLDVDGLQHRQGRAQRGVALPAERAMELLARKPGPAGGLRHAPGTRDDAQGIGHVAGIGLGRLSATFWMRSSAVGCGSAE